MASMVTDVTKVHPLQHCLEQIDSLAAELQHATEAITGNSLSSLEKSLHLQQERSAKLIAAVEKAQEAGEFQNSSAPALTSRVRQAARKLCGLNEQYAALLEHSGRSMRMLQALYQHASVPRSGMDPAHGGSGQHQTWSWEG